MDPEKMYGRTIQQIYQLNVHQIIFDRIWMLRKQREEKSGEGEEANKNSNV